MTTAYRVIEAPATDPQELEDFLNAQAADGWRALSVAFVPAGAVEMRVGGSFLRPETKAIRGFRTDGVASDLVSSTVIFNVWVTLQQDTFG